MNSKIYKYLAVGFCVLALNTGKIHAQLNCGLDDAMKKLFKDHPELEAQNEELMQSSRQNLNQYKLSHPVNSLDTSGSLYIIPTVFHIIHQYGFENISDAQVQDEMNILNRDYRCNNSDTANSSQPFKTIYADTKIEFRLATLDPDGNCTNGIDRVYSQLTNQGGDDSKLNDWPRNKYLNIWVVKSIGQAGAAGYAYYPSSVTGIGYTVDGVIMLQQYVGSIGTGSVGTSRSITHELGHYLNLKHCWGDNNNAGVACGDDGIADTPITKGWNLTCPPLMPPLYMNRVICSLPNDTIVENVENYMEYSYCSVMFTTDQGFAMRQALSNNISYRDCVVTPLNLLATGTDAGRLTTGCSQCGHHPYKFPAIINSLPVCVPVPDFSANRYYICQGGTITFTDQSWRAPVTSRTWTFANGTPSTSTLASPTITFNTWGWQNIKIVATSTAGSDSITKQAYVFVAPPWYDHFGTFSEGFENNDFPSGLWIVENMGNSYPTWQQTSSTSYNGTRCVAMNAYGTERDLVDAFITPSYDLTTCTNAVLNFKYSCATGAAINTNITEVFKVYVSTNCGQTWVNRKTLTSSTLANAGYSPSAFMPHSQSLWANCAVTLFAADMAPNVRFRFEYTSGLYSNNIYIDDINLSATVGINEVNNYFFDLNVYPNPSGGDNTINIGYTLSSQEKIKVSLVDMIGREVVVVNNEIEQAGEKLVTIDKNALDLKAGVYLVKITNGTSYTTRKLVITN